MSGLLDFALGFGSGAAGAFAQTKQMEIANRAEETRMKNLERLRAQYRRDELDYEYGKRAELAVLESSLETPEAPEAASTIGDEVTDMGFTPGTPEHAEEVRKRIQLREQNRARTRPTGSRVTLVNARGETRRVDAADDLDFYASRGFYPVVPESEEPDPSSKETFIRNEAGDVFIRRRGEFVPYLREVQEGPSERAARDSQESQDRSGPLYEFDPGAGVGPVDAALRGIASLPGMGSLFGSAANDERFKADITFDMVQKKLIRAQALNQDGRISNFDIELQIDMIPTKGRNWQNERAVFTKFERMADEQSMEIDRMNARLAEHERSSTMSPTQVNETREYIRTLEDSRDTINALLDARTLSSVRINNKPVGMLTDEEVESIRRRGMDSLEPNQQAALRVLARYRRYGR